MIENIFVLNRNKDIIGFFSNNGANPVAPFFNDVYTTILTSGAETYEFSTISNTITSELAELGNYIVFQYDEKFKMFQIMDIEDEHEEQQLISCYCEIAGLELLTDYCEPFSIEGNIETFFNTVLQDTNWNLGKYSSSLITNIQRVDVEKYTNVYKIIQDNIATYGNIEIEYRVDFDGNTLLGFFIDVYENGERGNRVYKRFEYGENVKGITRTRNLNDFASAIIGTGANGITFKDIEWSTAKGNPANKPLGQDFIVDIDANNKFNKHGKYIKKLYENEDTNPQDLLLHSWEYLKEVKEPKFDYDVNLGLTGIEYENIKIGDTNYVIDNEYNPPILLEARVGKLEISLSNSRQNKCTLSNYKEVQSNIRRDITDNKINEMIDTYFPIGGDKIGQGAIGNGHIDVTYYASIKTDIVQAAVVDVQYLIADKASIGELNALSATINSLKVNELSVINADIKNLKADKADITSLNATNASIENLKTNDLSTINASIESLKSNKADITQLNASNANIGTLQADVAKINTLVNGNLTSDNIQSLILSSDKVTVINGFIKNAMIESLDVAKINAGNISTNKFRIVSDDGGIEIVGATQQFKDKNNKVRVQIGRDAQGNFTFGLFDETGTGTLIDSTGVKAKAIGTGIIVNDMVSSTAGISGSKLDISSVITSINNGSTQIKGTKIYLDEQNQSLQVAFSGMNTAVSSQGSTISSHTTQLTTQAGQISTLISDSTIIQDGQSIKIKDAYSSLEQTVNGTIETISSLETEINKANTNVNKTVKSVKPQYYLSNSTTSETGGTWQDISPAWTNGKYMWQRLHYTYVDNTTSTGNATCIAGAKGDTGNQGIPGVAGTKGADGVTYYTWIKYADSSAGSGLSDSPTGKTYIGFAYNKITATESTTASDYIWSLIKGDKGDTGVPGVKGADGVTYYTWVKYSDNVNGNPCYDTPISSTKYIGIATNKTTATESSDYTQYIWSQFKGDEGATGQAGQSVTNVTPQFYSHTSSTTAPSSSVTWLDVCPAYVEGKYLWIRNKVTLTNPSAIKYTDAYYDPSWDAKSIADNASKTVTSKVAEFTKTVDGFTQRVSAVESNISNNYSTTSAMNTAISTSASGVITTVSQAYTSKEEFNNLQIGGRNLWIIRNLVNGYETNGSITSSTEVHKIMNTLTELNEAKYVTVQVWNSNLINNASNSNRIAFYTSTSTYISSVVTPKPNGTAYVKLIIPVPTNASYMRIGMICGSSVYDSSIKIKVELGNKPTDYTLSQEDTENLISTAVSNMGTDLQTQIDGKIETHTGTTDPSTSWTTTDLKTKHTGDLWYNGSNTNRWTGTAWSKLTDADATAANALASKKAQIFTTTPTIPYYKGDLWITSLTGTGTVKTCQTARTSGSYTASDWVEGLKYTDDTKASSVADDLSKNYSTTTQVGQLYDGLEVKIKESGGYNLLYNGDFRDGFAYWINNGFSINTASGSPSGITIWATGAIGVTKNITQYITTNLDANITSYTLSCWMYTSSSGSDGTTNPFRKLYAIITYTDDTTSSYNEGTTKYDTWEKVSVILTKTSGKRIKSIAVQCYCRDTTKQVNYSQVMIEKGKMANEFSPNPNEIYDGVTRIAKDGIKVSASNINGYTKMSADGFYVNANGVDVLSATSTGLTVKGSIVGSSITGSTFNSTNDIFKVLDDGSVSTDFLAVGEELSADRLSVNTISNPRYPQSLDSDISVFINPSATVSETDWFDGAVYKSYADLEATIPKNLQGFILTINLMADLTENIKIDNFVNGRIKLQLNKFILKGWVFNEVMNTRLDIFGNKDGSTGGTTNFGAIMPNTGYSISSYRYAVGTIWSPLRLWDVKIYKNNSTDQSTGCIFYNNGASGYVYNCVAVNSPYLFIRAHSCAYVYVSNSNGTTSDRPFHAVSGARIVLNNTTQTGKAGGGTTVSNHIWQANNGEVLTTGVTWDGTASSGTNDNTSSSTVTKTVKLTANSGDTYRSSYSVGWRKDGTVRQGNYGYGNSVGCWFFGSQISSYAGKSISKIVISFTRQAGGITSARVHGIKLHNHTSRPATAPTFLSTLSKTVSCAVGSTATLTLTSSTDIAAFMAAKGFGLVPASQTSEYYSVCSGSATVTMTYAE